MYKWEHFKCSKSLTHICVMINYTFFLQCGQQSMISAKLRYTIQGYLKKLWIQIKKVSYLAHILEHYYMS